MLSELAHTDAGFQLLKDLVNAHPKWVVMNNWDGKTNQTDIDGDLQNAYEKKDGTPSLGGNAVIKMNPTLTTYATPGGKELPWMTERVQFGLYHELVHAWHIQHGTLARGLHNRVDVAAQHERRRLQRLLVRDLDHIDAGGLDLQLVVGLDRLVFLVAGDLGRPFSVGGDEADVRDLVDHLVTHLDGSVRRPGG